MHRYLIFRIISSIISVVGASFIVFSVSVVSDDPLLLYAKPGGHGTTQEQLDALSAKLGLDRPVVVQWAIWMGNALSGDLGESLLDERPVTDKISERVGASLKLGIASWIFASLLGIPLGVIAAVKRGSPWDYLARGIALFGTAIPNFWLGIMLITVFSVQLQWLPVATSGPGFLSIPHLILPMVVLGTATAAGYVRITRSSMLEVLDSEFLRLARAKGVTHQRAIWKHALRNALIPPLTISSELFAGFITGSVLVETVFAWPGLGRLAIDAVNNNDFALVTGVTMFFVVIWVVTNLITDIAYLWVDPRIRLAA